MNDMIITKKVREKKELSKDIADTILLAKLAQASSPVDLAGRYIWAMSNADLNAAKKLGLTSNKKY